jgi:hypothetical protein
VYREAGIHASLFFCHQVRNFLSGGSNYDCFKWKKEDFKMMDYTMFQELVKDRFMDYMPEEFKNAKLSIEKVNKINATKDGLCIYREGDKGAPTIYVDDMYDAFKQTEDLEMTFKAAADFYARTVKEIPPIPVDLLVEEAKEKIYMVLINTESNQELLKSSPHREVNDTSVIYRIMVSDDEKGIGSTLITNSIAEKMEMDEEKLFQIAAENTPKLFPPTIQPLSQVLLALMIKEGGMPMDVADQVVAGMLDRENTMWMVSNDKGVSGAVNMIFEKNLYELAKKVNDDLYILPSSIHEVIAIPAKLGNPEQLAEMVLQVNSEVVDISERLSNQVYHYDRQARKLSMATDTPHKGIINEAAEVELVYDKEQQR